MIGWRCGKEVDGRGGVVTERKADLAVVVSRRLDRIAAGRHDAADGRRVVCWQGVRMVVPGVEDCLEQHRDNREDCSCPARRQRRPPDLELRGLS